MNRQTNIQTDIKCTHETIRWTMEGKKNPKRTEERKKSTRFSDLETPKITNVNKKESTKIRHENVEEEEEEKEEEEEEK